MATEAPTVDPFVIINEEDGSTVGTATSLNDCLHGMKTGQVEPGKYAIHRRVRIGIEVSSPVTKTRVTTGQRLQTRTRKAKKEDAPF